MKCGVCGERLADVLTLAPLVAYGRHVMCGPDYVPRSPSAHPELRWPS